VVRYDPKASERGLDVMRWGLVPYWAKDIKVAGRPVEELALAGRRVGPQFRDYRDNAKRTVRGAT
jgi:putative SOS response-associated peptidase YedK